MYIRIYMKQIFYAILAVMVAGCGKSKQDERAKLEEAEKTAEIQATEEQSETDIEQEEQRVIMQLE